MSLLDPVNSTHEFVVVFAWHVAHNKVASCDHFQKSLFALSVGINYCRLFFHHFDQLLERCNAIYYHLFFRFGFKCSISIKRHMRHPQVSTFLLNLLLCCGVEHACHCSHGKILHLLPTNVSTIQELLLDHSPFVLLLLRIPACSIRPSISCRCLCITITKHFFL